MLAALVGGPLAASSFGFISALNTTSTANPLTIFAPVNSALARFANHTGAESLLTASLIYGTHGNTSLEAIIAANHIVPGAALNSTLIADALIHAPGSHQFPLGISYGATHLTTLAGLNVSVKGFVTNNTRLPIPPLIMVQNALVIQPNAIIAANGVVHLISNLIDPLIPATGGFYGPTVEILRGLQTLFTPLIRLVMTLLETYL
jgi:uncharacterized surface protein with fasciclin (FAS1) repeats